MSKKSIKKGGNPHNLYIILSKYIKAVLIKYFANLQKDTNIFNNVDEFKNSFINIISDKKNILNSFYKILTYNKTKNELHDYILSKIHEIILKEYIEYESFYKITSSNKKKSEKESVLYNKKRDFYLIINILRYNSVNINSLLSHIHETLGNLKDENSLKILEYMISNKIRDEINCSKLINGGNKKRKGGNDKDWFKNIQIQIGDLKIENMFNKKEDVIPAIPIAPPRNRRVSPDLLSIRDANFIDILMKFINLLFNVFNIQIDNDKINIIIIKILSKNGVNYQNITELINILITPDNIKIFLDKILNAKFKSNTIILEAINEEYELKKIRTPINLNTFEYDTVDMNINLLLLNIKNIINNLENNNILTFLSINYIYKNIIEEMIIGNIYDIEIINYNNTYISSLNNDIFKIKNNYILVEKILDDFNNASANLVEENKLQSSYSNMIIKLYDLILNNENRISFFDYINFIILNIFTFGSIIQTALINLKTLLKLNDSIKANFKEMKFNVGKIIKIKETRDIENKKKRDKDIGDINYII